MPALRSFCLEKEKCLMLSRSVKHLNVVIRLVLEIINEFSNNLTNRALFVLVIIFSSILILFKNGIF